jgi:hypothetical protein
VTGAFACLLKQGRNMNFTDKQKKMISCINEMRITTIYDLIKLFKDIKEEPFEKKMNGNIEAGRPYFVILEKDIPEIIQIIIDVDNLCILLQNMKVIGVLENAHKYDYIQFITKKYYESYELIHELNVIIEKYKKRKYVTTSALEEFIYNNYKTNEEIELNSERTARKNAEKFTRRIALFSIIVSLIIGIGTTIFNYLTYTKEREMIIVNPGEINYPVDIKNLGQYMEIQERYIEKIDELIQKVNKQTEE